MTSYKGSPKDILKSLVIILPGGERGSWRILEGGGGGHMVSRCQSSTKNKEGTIEN